MSLNNHYYYDEESCDFVPIKYKRREQIVYNLAIWILNGVVIAGIGIILLSSKIGTPSELALKAENEALIAQLEETKVALINIDEKLSEIAARDNEVYRSVLGLDSISFAERKAGIGGAANYEQFEHHSTPTNELLKWTSEKIDNLERKIGIQNLSFEELKHEYNKNSEEMRHIPAIKPGSGILLSGYGMRFHPILGYEKPHNGLDFRANVGAPVYATGDGKIKYAGRQGTLGKIIIIDHGYGYETLYAHLSDYEDGIKSGTLVKRGQQIGKAGESGLAEGPHIHYEIRLNGKHVNPLYYLFADTSPEEYLMFKRISETNTKSLD
jgi:murein DD-endopeptidase MepM/ murein hydrolase activator NlpD